MGGRSHQSQNANHDARQQAKEAYDMSNTETRRVAVSTLNIDPAIQRQLDRRRVERIANDLNVDAIGVITVSQREGGSLFVVDGMHRVEALKLAGGEGESVDARVFTGLTIAEDRKSTRLNSSHSQISYAVFCLK